MIAVRAGEFVEVKDGGTATVSEGGTAQGLGTVVPCVKQA